MKATKAGILALGGFVLAMLVSYVLRSHSSNWFALGWQGLESTFGLAQAFGIWTLVFVVLWRK